jgi:hypothetical protein
MTLYKSGKKLVRSHNYHLPCPIKYAMYIHT